MARAESEACSVTVVAYDKKYTAASVKATIRWNINTGMIRTRINHTLSMAPSEVVQTARSLAALQNGVTTSVLK